MTLYNKNWLPSLEKKPFWKYFIQKQANFVLALGFLACILLPDFVINVFMKSNRLFWDWVHVLCLALLCYGLSFLKKSTFSFWWLFFALLEIIQLSHIVYFGIPVSPNAIMAVLYEYRDIFNPLYLKAIWFVFPVVALFYGIGFYGFLLLFDVKNSFKLRSFLVITYAMSLIATDGMTLRPVRLIQFMGGESNWLIHRCFRREAAPSLRESLFLLSSLGILNFFHDAVKTYKPYRTFITPAKASNIILIMGESFSANRLSLFGYHRPTTPYLEALKKDKDRFIYRRAYAAAPNTINSILYFFNSVREPDNFKPLTNETNNLFRWAKAQGFKTFLITNNGGSIHMGTSEYVMTSRPLENYPLVSISKSLQKFGDRGLAHALKELPLSAEKNFIVLHLINSHSPYGSFDPQEQQEKFRFYPEKGVSSREATSNAYDNNVHYVDSVLQNISETCQQLFKDKGRTCVIFTADHGELFGEKDPVTQSHLFGHCHLSLLCAHVPFFLYSLTPISQDIRQLVPSRPTLAAYEISQLILSLMGVKLLNPNQKNLDQFYVTEGPLGGGRRSLAYILTEQGEAICKP